MREHVICEVMKMRKLKEVLIEKKFMTYVDWEGEKGTTDDEMRCIAFLPKSCTKNFFGRKLSVVLRGKKYLDSYTGDVWSGKGWVVAIPFEEYDGKKSVRISFGYSSVKYTVSVGDIEGTAYQDFSGQAYRKLAGRTIEDVAKEYLPEEAKEFPISEIKIEKKVWKDTFEEEKWHVTARISIEDGVFKYSETRNEKLNKLNTEELLRHITLLQPERYKIKFCIPNDREYFVGEYLMDSEQVRITRHSFGWNENSDDWETRHPKAMPEVKITIGDKNFEAVFETHKEIASTQKFWNEIEQFKLNVDTTAASRFLKDFLENAKKELTQQFAKEVEESKEHIKEYKEELKFVRENGVPFGFQKMSRDKLKDFLLESTGLSLQEEIIVSFASDEYRDEEEVFKQKTKIKEKIKALLEKLPETVWVKSEEGGEWDGMYVESDETYTIIVDDDHIITGKYRLVNDGYEEESFEDFDFNVQNKSVKQEVEQLKQSLPQTIQELQARVTVLRKYLTKLQQPVTSVFSKIFRYYFGEKYEARL